MTAAALVALDSDAARIRHEPARERLNPIATSTPRHQAPAWPPLPPWRLQGRHEPSASQRTAGPQMDKPHDDPRPPRRRGDRPQLSLRGLLAAVGSTRQTRLKLLCRQLNMEESRVRPAWDLARRTQLVEPVAIDANTGETMHRLSDRGRRALFVERRRGVRALNGDPDARSGRSLSNASAPRRAASRVPHAPLRRSPRQPTPTPTGSPPERGAVRPAMTISPWSTTAPASIAFRCLCSSSAE